MEHPLLLTFWGFAVGFGCGVFLVVFLDWLDARAFRRFVEAWAELWRRILDGGEPVESPQEDTEVGR